MEQYQRELAQVRCAVLSNILSRAHFDCYRPRPCPCQKKTTICKFTLSRHPTPISSSVSLRTVTIIVPIQSSLHPGVLRSPATCIVEVVVGVAFTLVSNLFHAAVFMMQRRSPDGRSSGLGIHPARVRPAKHSNQLRHENARCNTIAYTYRYNNTQTTPSLRLLLLLELVQPVNDMLVLQGRDFVVHN